MSRRLPALRPRQVIRALQRGGFVVHHVSGHFLAHPEKPGLRVSIPFHHKDLKPKTLRSILRQAGLTTDAFLDLL